jgi:hypothetical protein
MLATKLRGTVDGKDGIIGIRVIAQDSEEQNVLRRLFDGGMKVNSVVANGEEIGITFSDLIK